MAYNFYMDGIQLPIAPSKIQTKIKNTNKALVLVNEGEVNFLKEPGLTEIDFDVMIPQTKYPFAIYPDGFKRASYYLDLFKRLKVDKKPFQFIVSRVSPGGDLLFDTEILVSLEDYSFTEDAKNGLDLMVDISLKQYREYGTKTLRVTTASNTGVVKAKVVMPRQTTKDIPKTYTVKKGDKLWTICKNQLGDGAKYTEIAKLNKLANSNLIYEGQVLKLG